MSHYHHHNNNETSEGQHIGQELRHHQYGQARHDLISELHQHPKEFHHLLQQVNHELTKHHQSALSVEHDKHHHITHIDFNHHNIYDSPRHASKHSDAAATAHHARSHAPEGAHHPSEAHHKRPVTSERPHSDARNPESPGQPGDGKPAPPDASAKPADQPPGRPGEQPQNQPNDAKNPIQQTAEKIGDALGTTLKQFGHDLAHLASDVAHRLGTVGDCAHGPRLAFDKVGFHLPPAVATE